MLFVKNYQINFELIKKIILTEKFKEDIDRAKQNHKRLKNIVFRDYFHLIYSLCRKNRWNLLDKFNILFQCSYFLRESNLYNYMIKNEEVKHYHTSSSNSTLSARWGYYANFSVYFFLRQTLREHPKSTNEKNRMMFISNVLFIN